MSQATESTQPAIPSEVLVFAEQQKVLGLMPVVLEMTKRIFPAAILSVQLEGDPEIACDRHIVVVASDANAEVPQVLAARYRWHAELFACCPAPLVWVFRLGLEIGR